LDFLPEYQKEAEELLSKAIKLRPSWNEPLNALGHVYWKKGDFANSILCYRQAMEENPSDKVAPRNLSMVLRMQSGIKDEERPAIWKESIALASKAVSLDFKDAHSWYILGNAHLTCYFLETERYEHLNFALKAYT